MKAVVIYQYGSAEMLRYEDVEVPKIKPNQLLIKVDASCVNPIDWKIRKGMLQLITGYKFPMTLGLDVAGAVVEVGSQVKHFQPGDAIYGSTDLFGGAYAEYAAVSEQWVAPKPTNITYPEAAVVVNSGLTALQCLRNQGHIQPGQAVLVNGAAGGVGTFAVQIAKALGAEVTGVCSGKNLALVKSLGADFVIDYTQQDFTQVQVRYDIVLDAVAKSSFSQCKQILKPDGVYITTLPSLDIVVQGVLTAFLPGQKAKLILTQPNTQDLIFLKELIESGKVRAIIDRTYPLQELAAAHAYSETERAAGKIAIAIG